MAQPFRAAIRSAIADLPAAVGPQMTRSARSSAPEASLELIPAEVYEDGAAVHVVCGKPAAPKVAVESLHLVMRECVTSLHRGLARNGCRQQLVPRVHAGHTVAGERVESLTQTSLGVEPGVR